MRSLLSQLIWSHLAVAAGTVVVTGVLTAALFAHYYVAQQEQVITEQARQLAAASARAMSHPGSTDRLALLSDIGSRMVNGRVCVIDLRNQSVAATGGTPETVSADLTADLTPPEDDRPQVEHTTLLCMTGPVLSIKMPILSSGTRARIGTLVIRCPVSGMQAIPEAERAILTIAGIAGIALAFIVAMALAPRLTRPLSAAAEAAHAVAGGDFQVRLPESGSGEARTLAASINTMAAELADAFGRLEGERDRLRDLERMRRDFIANASHELRAPLTSMQGFVTALKDGTARTEEQKARCIEVSLQQAAIMRQLVDQLLELSRLQSGGVELERERLNLAEIVHGAAAGMTPQAQAAGVQITVQADSAVVNGDGYMLSRVVGNLLDNAVRVAPRGSTIDVTLTAADGRVRVSVADSGPGIPEEDLPLIWERFHKADKAHSRDTVGAGLGLAIAREIISRHGGTVGASNREDGGAEVWFEVPMG